MKFLLVVLLAVAFGEKYTEKLFADWAKEHGKEYGTQAEAIRRFGIFSTNLAWINKRNGELEHMTVGLNEFADMTEKEFASIYLHPLNETEWRKEIAEIAVPQDPNNIHIGGKCATPVRNQGQCGSCWAFAAGCAAEALLCQGWTSTQELVDCTCSGCNGGWPSQALSYYKSKGVCWDKEYPYTARKGSCSSSKCSHTGINTVNSCQDSGGGITSALAGNFVAIAIDAGGLDFMFYKSGSFMPGVNCNHHSVNHAVTAVASSANGNYRVKNSWGASWGNQGYFTMPAGVNCLGVNNNPSVYPS
jgi:cathepsin L